MQLDRIIQRTVQTMVWGVLGYFGATLFAASIWFWAAIW